MEAERTPLLERRVEVPPSAIRLPSVDELREFAATTGMLGKDVRPILDNFGRHFDDEIDFLKDRKALYDRAASSQRASLVAKLHQQETDNLFLRLDEPDLLQRLEDARLEEDKKRGELRAIIRKVRVRGPSPEEYQDDRERRRRRRQREDLDARIELAEKRAALVQQRKKNNAQLVDDLLSGIKDDRTRIQAALDQVREMNRRWQLAGFTSQIASFLILCSLLSLGGIASLLAHLLMMQPGLLPGNGTSTTGWIQRLQAVFGLQPPLNITHVLVGLLWYMLAVSLVLGFILLVVVAVLAAIRWLDPQWRSRHSRQTKGGHSSTEDIAGWLGFFHLSPSILSGKLSAIDRGSLVQLVASLPLAAAAALAAFVWMLVGSENANSGNKLGVGIFAFLPIPWAYVLLMSGAGVMLFLVVIRPTLAGPTRFGSDDTTEKAQLSRPPVWTAILYVMIFIFPMASLMASAFTATDMSHPTEHAARDAHIVLAFQIASLLTTLIGLAHGLFLRGVFERERSLEDDLDRFDSLSFSLQYQPTAADFYEGAPSNISVNIVDSTPAARRSNLSPLDELSRKMHQWYKNLKSTLLSRKDDLDGSSEDADEALSISELEKAIERRSIKLTAESIDEVNSAMTAYANAQAERRQAERMFARCQERIKVTEEGMVDASRALGRLDAVALDVADQHHRRTIETETNKRQTLETIDHAYWLGHRDMQSRAVTRNRTDRGQHLLPPGEENQ